MKPSLAAYLMFATIAFTVTLVRPVSADRRASHDTATTAAGVAADVSAVQNKGRYKTQGDECVWDANDGGPNQCTPQTRGRFKKGAGGACTWESNDTGADQCTPKQGRWKKGDGNRCYWDPKDSGSNQCNPRQARK